MDMTTKWVTKAFSKNSTPVEIDEELLDEKVVILLQGKNVFGDDIFSYLELTLRNMMEIKNKLVKGENFMPSDLGTVLAAGKGEPSEELRQEMAVKYNMIDVPRPRPQNFNAPQPKVWDDGEF